MNSIMRDYFPTFEMYQALRAQLMEILTNEDLQFRLPGQNLPLGVLCREIGEVEYAYIQSFKTFRIDFSYQNPETGLESSTGKLVAWYKELDDDLKRTIEALPEEDVQNRKIDRGGGFTPPLFIQLDLYKEALLIFYGKVSVYLKALEKPIPEQWQHWIG